MVIQDAVHEQLEVSLDGEEEVFHEVAMVELPAPVIKMVKLDSGMVEDGEHEYEDANSSKLSLVINENLQEKPVVEYLEEEVSDSQK